MTRCNGRRGALSSIQGKGKERFESAFNPLRGLTQRYIRSHILTTQTTENVHHTSLLRHHIGAHPCRYFHSLFTLFTSLAPQRITLYGIRKQYLWISQRSYLKNCTPASLIFRISPGPSLGRLVFLLSVPSTRIAEFASVLAELAVPAVTAGPAATFDVSRP
jgi:hypothetical protein